MAQGVHTSQFGTKVWDARRVELPEDGQGAAQPDKSGCSMGCNSRFESREHVYRRHASSLPSWCCQECCPARHRCCPIGDSVVRVHGFGQAA